MNKTKKRVVGIVNLRAMLLSRLRGKQLLEDHPEIAQKWEAGKYLADLAEEYCPTDESLAVGINAVHYVIKKLVPDRERRRIAEKHKVEATREPARARGKRDYKMHRGIWHPKNAARLAEGRKKGGQISGAIVGKRNYRAGKGIAAFTSKERHLIGQKSARARGEVPFEDKKKRTEFGLLNEKEYIIRLKILKGLTWLQILRRDNRVFRYKRKKKRRLETIRTMFNKRWKKEIEENKNKAR